MQPFSGNQRPDLLTSLMNMSFVLRLPQKMHLCRSSSNAPRLPWFLEMLQNPHVLVTFDKVHNPLRLPCETTSEPPKMVRTWCALYILTWKCASLHSGVHFCDISTSKSGPHLVCFVHFDLEMCFAPQRRALFRHLNFQKWSEAGVLCIFWLGNVLRATTACTFATSQVPKVVRTWCVFYILTWKCAARHNGAHFFISPLDSWLRTRRFSEPTFRPSGATNHWKNTVFRDFPTFSRISIFFLLTLSLLPFSLLIFLFSLPLPCSAFHLSMLSKVWLRNFLRQSFFYLECLQLQDEHPQDELVFQTLFVCVSYQVERCWTYILLNMGTLIWLIKLNMFSLNTCVSILRIPNGQFRLVVAVGISIPAGGLTGKLAPGTNELLDWHHLGGVPATKVRITSWNGWKV